MSLTIIRGSTEGDAFACKGIAVSAILSHQMVVRWLGLVAVGDPSRAGLTGNLPSGAWKEPEFGVSVVF